MAVTLNSKKLVVIQSIGALPELGGISGPIINPSLIGVDTIVRLLNNHRAVYEVNPANLKERVRLNLKNVKRENFPPVTVQPTAKILPKNDYVVNTKEPAKEEVKHNNDYKKESKNDFTKK